MLKTKDGTELGESTIIVRDSGIKGYPQMTITIDARGDIIISQNIGNGIHVLPRTSNSIEVRHNK